MKQDSIRAGSVLGGKLQVVRRLGVGGMGEVYEVEHVFTKHRRALKLLHPDLLANPAAVERFLREASAAGRIANPHIVETFDAGRLESGEPFLVMELLDGEELSKLLAREGRLEIGLLVDLVRQACDGVQAAHDSRIVHRDLKPENLFIVRRDGRPFVKILDFGISKFDASVTGDHGVTREGAVLGTPYYMPPEQVRGAKDIDARADVYALGVILYECATGKRPFVASTLPHLALLIHEGKPIPLEERRPEIPRGFSRVVAKAMAVDRAVRFSTVAELSRALEPFALSLHATQLAPSVAALPAQSSGTLAMLLATPERPAEPRDESGLPSIEAGALGRTAAARPPPTRAGYLVGAGVLIVVGAGVLLSRPFRSGSVPASTDAAASSGSSLVLETQSAPVVASSAPVVAPSVVREASSAPSSRPTADAGGGEQRSRGLTPTAPSASSKADVKGLQQKNPY